MQKIQSLATQVVGQVLAGQNLTQTLNNAWQENSGLTPQQRGAIQDISYGTLRFYGQLDTILARLLKTPALHESLRILLLVALYQLQYTKAAKYAVVDHAVNAVQALRQTSAKGLVNAVLRNFLRNQQQLVDQAADEEAGRYSHQAWWIAKLKAQYPERYIEILDANNLRPPMTLRVNTRQVSRDDYLAQLQTLGLAAQAVGEFAITLAEPCPIDELPGFSKGWVSVQDLSAQHAATLLDVSNSMRVLDACAAPGGKTAHLLDLANLDLTAVDADRTRIARIKDNLLRQALFANLVCGDAGKPDMWWDGEPYQRILADVPCSASGVVKRHPDIKWLRRESDIAQFVEQQKQILNALWQLLERGGKLLYVTCSIFKEENQDQVSDFLTQHHDAKLLPIPFSAENGQILPDASHDGFFYALLQKY